MSASSAGQLTASSCRPSTRRLSSRRVNTFCSLPGRRQTLREKKKNSPVPGTHSVRLAWSHAGTTKTQFCHKKMSSVYRCSPVSPFCRAQTGAASQDEQRSTKQTLCSVSCSSPRKPPNSAFSLRKVPRDIYLRPLFLSLDSRVAADMTIKQPILALCLQLPAERMPV